MIILKIDKDLMFSWFSVSLEDMYNGTTRKLALQKNVICDACEGSDFLTSISNSQL